MESLVLLIDSTHRTTGSITNFAMNFDTGITFAPELIKVLNVILTPQSVPPRRVLYLCSDIIGGYNNGYYNIGSTINNYCIIAVIPVLSILPTVYDSYSSQPYFTCLGTMFGKKSIIQKNKTVQFMLLTADGLPANVTTDWICTIECKKKI